MRPLFQPPASTIGMVAISGSLILGLLLVPPAIAREPTVAMALKAEATDLLIAYINAQIMTNIIDMAANNVTIETPEGRIDSRNAPKWRAIFQARKSTYTKAVRQRGYQTGIAGDYRVISVSPECANSYSTLLAGVMEADFAGLNILQSGPDVTIRMKLKIPADKAGETATALNLDFTGATIESAIAAVDPLNSDYYVTGIIDPDKRIVLTPSPKVLRNWPSWAPRPNQSDLLKCRVKIAPFQWDREGKAEAQ